MLCSPTVVVVKEDTGKGPVPVTSGHMTVTPLPRALVKDTDRVWEPRDHYYLR